VTLIEELLPIEISTLLKKKRVNMMMKIKVGMIVMIYLTKMQRVREMIINLEVKVRKLVKIKNASCLKIN
jgi:hypothetical protein